jgi:prepilin-type processing-associated H-X9-DG protein
MRSRRVLAATCCAIVGSIFIVAALLKLVRSKVLLGPTEISIVDRWIQDSPPRLIGLILAEGSLGIWLLAARRQGAPCFAAIVVLSTFAGCHAREIFADHPVPCGCFGSISSMVLEREVRRNLLFSLTFTLLLTALCAFAFWIIGQPQRGSPRTCSESLISDPPCAQADRRSLHGITLVEVLVVIGVIAILIAITVPIIRRMRAVGARTQCASNLHQLGVGFHAYAAENRGTMPRYGNYARLIPNDPPIWIVAIAPYISHMKSFDWADYPTLSALSCPAHPVIDIPTAFVLNTFAFETQPSWDGALPVPTSKMRTPSELPWLLEASDAFGMSAFGPFDAIFYEPYHIVREPAHLAGGAKSRINDARHVHQTSNVLYLDGHVDAVRHGTLQLTSFDDGVRQR